jgi:hypothetical protein
MIQFDKVIYINIKVINENQNIDISNVIKVQNIDILRRDKVQNIKHCKMR